MPRTAAAEGKRTGPDAPRPRRCRRGLEQGAGWSSGDYLACRARIRPAISSPPPPATSTSAAISNGRLLAPVNGTPPLAAALDEVWPPIAPPLDGGAVGGAAVVGGAVVGEPVVGGAVVGGAVVGGAVVGGAVVGVVVVVSSGL